MTYDARAHSIPELLRDWAAIMGELRRRTVLRTNNMGTTVHPSGFVLTSR